MAFDTLEAEISLLLTQMENQPEDQHEVYLQLQEKINEMRAYGMPVPDDLKKLMADLEADLNKRGGKTGTD